MNADKQIEIYNKIDKELLEITMSKREDYADDDVLKNFKAVSLAAKALEIDITKSSQYALFMVLLKICRLTNLMNSNKTPKNESVEDSWKDGINYFKLGYCCWKDETI